MGSTVSKPLSEYQAAAPPPEPDRMACHRAASKRLHPARLLAVLASLPVPLVQAQTQEEVPPVFSETVEVRVVNIEVVVTDRAGNRVTGLGPEDFRLRVDEEEVAIEFFTEIVDGEALESAQPGALDPVPAMVEGGVVGVSYLVFIDDFFSIARDRDRVLKALSQDLDSLGPADRMAFVAFDGKNLELLSNWTSSRHELEAALARATERRAFGLQQLSARRTADQDRRFQRRFRTGFARGLSPLSRNYALRLADQVERSVLAAVTALRSFASPPGRKVMLLLSGGWPFSPAEYTANTPDATFEEAVAGSFETGVKGRSRLLDPLSDTANLLGYTLYPVDVPGSTPDAAVDASESRPRSLNRLGGFAREQQVHSSLSFLADKTGGRPLLNAGRNQALRRVAQDTRSYYWLGFTPRRQEDNQRHRVRVEVLRPGLRVRSREGFVDLSRQTEVTMMVEGALLLGDPPSTLGLELNFGKAKRSGFGKVHVPLTVGIPLDEVTLLPVDGQYRGEVEIRVTVMDNKGYRSDTVLGRVPISGATRPSPGDRYRYETTLAMRRRQHRIVVAVHDPLSGTILSSVVEFSP